MTRPIVIKLGGSILDNSENLIKKFLGKIVRYLNQRPAIIVHGGGPTINQYLKRLNVPVRFIQGLRYTDAETLTVVRFVLNGLVNPRLTFLFNQLGRKAIGVSGEAGIVFARRQRQLGYVGEPEKIEIDRLKKIQRLGLTPVISCLGRSARGEVLNINADTLAQFIAESLFAEELVLFTDVSGVLDGCGRTIPVIYQKEISALIKRKIVTGGMITKIRAVEKALRAGVKNIVIVSARYGFSPNKYTVIKK